MTHSHAHEHEARLNFITAIDDIKPQNLFVNETKQNKKMYTRNGERHVDGRWLDADCRDAGDTDTDRDAGDAEMRECKDVRMQRCRDMRDAGSGRDVGRR